MAPTQQLTQSVPYLKCFETIKRKTMGAAVHLRGDKKDAEACCLGVLDEWR
jgi:hypothetical protein